MRIRNDQRSHNVRASSRNRNSLFQQRDSLLGLTFKDKCHPKLRKGSQCIWFESQNVPILANRVVVTSRAEHKQNIFSAAKVPCRVFFSAVLHAVTCKTGLLVVG